MPISISQEYLKSILDYSPETGIFIWKRYSGNNLYSPGDIAGRRANHGNKCDYIMIGIDKQIYRAHRLAFLYMTGEIPSYIDHKDRDGTNNKWSNLRAANKQSNAANTAVKSHNTSGFKGVSYRSDDRRVKKWRACVYKDGKQLVIGTYSTKEEAARAHDEAALKYFGDFAVTNKQLGLL